MIPKISYDNALTMNDLFSDKVGRLSEFKKKITLLESSTNVKSDILLTISTKPATSEFYQYFTTIDHYLNERNVHGDRTISNIIIVMCDMLKYMEEDVPHNVEAAVNVIDRVSDKISNIIEDGNFDESKLSALKSQYHNMMTLIAQLKYAKDGISEKVAYVTSEDLQEEAESVSMHSVQESVYEAEVDGEYHYLTISDISVRFSNAKTVDEVIDILPSLREYFDTLDVSNMCTKMTEILLDYIYGILVRHVSALRLFKGHLEYGLSNISKQDVDTDNPNESIQQHVSLLKNKINKIDNRVSSNLNECINFEYDVILELGLDYLYDIVPKSMLYSDEVLTEGAIKDKIKKGVRKVKFADKQVSRKIDNSVQRVVDDYREARKNDMEDKIIKSTFRASKLLKTLIATGAIALLGQAGPALALIFLIVRFCLHKKTELKYKRRLLNELKEELRIVEEKVKDADRNGDNKAKYKLMRIENQLKLSIDKIEYNLKTY